MRPFIRIFAATLTLSACTPVSVYHKTGAAVTRAQDDLLSCEVAALKDAPVASQIRHGPPRFIPGGRYCSASGSCYRRGGYYIPGEVYSYDVNARLRKDLETRCMSRKGYTPVALPRCRAAEAPAPTPSSRSVIPALSPNTCVVRGASGAWQIIDPTD